MTTFQKIVKYGALIFAGYLCLMIISGNDNNLGTRIF